MNQIEYKQLPEIIKKWALPPKYIQLPSGTCLIYSERRDFLEPLTREYFRHAGAWSIGILKAIDGDESWYVLDCSKVSDTPLYDYHLTTVVPCSKKQWQESNKGYF